MARDLRMYLLVNKEIQISKGKLSGQIGHGVNVLTYYMTKCDHSDIHEYMQETNDATEWIEGFINSKGKPKGRFTS